MFLAATIALVMTMALAILRALMGPTVFDRVMAVNMFGTKTVLLIAVLAYIQGRPGFLDLALAYALINFIGTMAVLRFTTRGRGPLAAYTHRDESAGEPEEEP